MQGASYGLIYDIQRYSIHDGPGIRTVAFLKGCPLKCLWCQNPESQSAEPEIMFRPRRCIGCRECIKVCPHQAIRDTNGVRRIERSLCDGCGRCVQACPAGASTLAGRKISVDELVAELERDRAFYEESAGGITLSGGEPLFQADFVRQVLARCRDKGLHTAVETSGYAPWAIVEQILPYTDLVLYDLKHMDTAKHAEFTGRGNEPILRNLKMISTKMAPVIIRIPVIPGYNDSDENIESIACFVRQLETIREIHLLPYHKLGEPKYAMLGRKYQPAITEVPRSERLESLADHFRRYGFVVQLGG